MSLFKKLEDRVHTIPLKERIEQALFRLNTQKAKLEQTSMRLQQRDKEMFQRTVGAELSKDGSHARLYANECAEIRKMAHIVLSSELALERVILRLQTIEEFGDIMTQIAPVIGIVRETRGRIAGVIPAVAVAVSEAGDDAEIPRSSTLQRPFEDRLLEYIKSRNGEISISNCSTDLSVGTDEIKRGLERLRGDGKIVIE